MQVPTQGITFFCCTSNKDFVLGQHGDGGWIYSSTGHNGPYRQLPPDPTATSPTGELFDRQGIYLLDGQPVMLKREDGTVFLESDMYQRFNLTISKIEVDDPVMDPLFILRDGSNVSAVYVVIGQLDSPRTYKVLGGRMDKLDELMQPLSPSGVADVTVNIPIKGGAIQILGANPTPIAHLQLAGQNRRPLQAIDPSGYQVVKRQDRYRVEANLSARVG